MISYLLFTLSGNYTRLVLQFELRRNVLYFILETYVPSTFLVVLSWVSFWISLDSVPARTCIGKELQWRFLKTELTSPSFNIYTIVFTDMHNAVPGVGFFRDSFSRRSASLNLCCTVTDKEELWLDGLMSVILHTQHSPPVRRQNVKHLESCICTKWTKWTNQPCSSRPQIFQDELCSISEFCPHLASSSMGTVCQVIVGKSSGR